MKNEILKQAHELHGKQRENGIEAAAVTTARAIVTAFFGKG